MSKYRVAIQGQEGCYHEWAARQYFESIEGADSKPEDVEVVCCNTFQSEFEAMAADASLLGIMAIENTIAGNILQNHELLRNSQRQIVGEHRLHISHVLCALPGTKLEDVVEVNSHPIALLQCEVFLQNTLPNAKVVEMADTAGSAKIIKEHFTIFINEDNIKWYHGVLHPKIKILRFIIYKDHSFIVFKRFNVLESLSLFFFSLSN